MNEGQGYGISDISSKLTADWFVDLVNGPEDRELHEDDLQCTGVEVSSILVKKCDHTNDEQHRVLQLRIGMDQWNHNYPMLLAFLGGCRFP